MLRKFCHTISWPGALSNATYTWSFKVPSDCTLLHVSMSQSNATVASTCTIGTSADADGYMTTAAALFVASGACGSYGLSSFDGALVDDPGRSFPRIAKDTIVRVTVVGTAANQATDGIIVLTFAEG
jgi:hypothetical protein